MHTPTPTIRGNGQRICLDSSGFVSFFLLNLIDDLFNVIRSVTGFHIEIVLHGLAGLSLLQPWAFDNIFKVNLPASAGFYQRFPQNPKSVGARGKT